MRSSARSFALVVAEVVGQRGGHVRLPRQSQAAQHHVLGPGLQQQHGLVGVFAQAVGENATRRPCPHDDVTVRGRPLVPSGRRGAERPPLVAGGAAGKRAPRGFDPGVTFTWRKSAETGPESPASAPRPSAE